MASPLTFNEILIGLKGLADEYDDMRQQLAGLQSEVILRPAGPTKPTLHKGASASTAAFDDVDWDQDHRVPTERPNGSDVPQPCQCSTSNYSQVGCLGGLEKSPTSHWDSSGQGLEKIPTSHRDTESNMPGLEKSLTSHLDTGTVIFLRNCWKSDGDGIAVEQTRSFYASLSRESGRSNPQTKLALLSDGPDKFQCIMSPNRRLVWDLVGMALLFYDILTIPLGVFDPEQILFFAAMDWITLLFWTGDMFMSCMTSYVHEGTVIYTKSLIFMNYLKTWFILDLVVNLPDWIAIFLEWAGKSSGGGSVDIGFLRSLRVIRSVRLLRLVKLKRILAMIKDRIASEAVFIVLNIIKLLSMLVLMNHLIACAWYAIGGIEPPPNNWRFIHDMTPETASLGMRYATSLHWALTQFTPANSGVEPQNALERWFAIQILIIGLVSSSSFISSITGSMAQLRNMDADRSKQFWLLRRYLKQKEVPMELCFKVLRYTDFIANTKQEGIDEKRITILDSLTDELRNQLRFVIRYRSITSHGLFAKLSKSHKNTLFAMAGSVLSEKLLAVEDSLFSVIDEPTCMYYVRAGSLKYTLIRRQSNRNLCRAQSSDEEDAASARKTSNASSSPGVVLNSDEYLCEVVLWADWVHMGKAKALAETNIINVDAQAFCDLMRKDQLLMEWLCCYAREFVNYMLIEAVELIEITDFIGAEDVEALASRKIQQ